MTIDKLSAVLKLHGFDTKPFIGVDGMGVHLLDDGKRVYDTVYLINGEFSPDGKTKGSLTNWLGY